MGKEKSKTRIKIRDLARDKKVSEEEMKKIKGGFYKQPMPGEPWYPPTKGPIYW